MTKRVKGTVSGMILGVLLGTPQFVGASGRDYISIVGSSTVYPFATASRRIKKSEVERCSKNGINEITEIKIGYDGIVIANSKKSRQMGISLRELFLALRRES